jgi:hypothetical protein
MTGFDRRALLKATGAAGLATTGLVATLTTPAQANDVTILSRQGGWRWCNRCQCLFYGDNYTTGWCPDGGGHNWQGSGYYYCGYDDYGNNRQQGWKWCRKCQGFWYGGDNNNKGRCPSGRGGHDKQGSGNYYCEYGNPPGGNHQTGWRWCRKCYCLWYSQGNQGHCAGGGYHDYNGSGNYYLDYQ